MIYINYITNYKIIENIFNNFIKHTRNSNLYYSGNLKNHVDNEINKSLNEKIIIATQKIKKNLDKNFYTENDLNIWNICVTKNNFMFNYPFTLSNIIFIPKNIINSKDIVNTLIHEKIHIFQRYNINYWNNYILDNTPFKLCKMVLYDNEILNPDTLYEFNFIYSHNNQSYRGIILYDKNNIKEYWTLNNKITFDNNLPTYTHPYEVYAYKWADMINNDEYCK